MKILQIEDKDLDYLIETKRDYIGTGKIEWVNVIGGVALAISAFSSEFNLPHDIGIVLKTLLVVFGVVEVAMECVKRRHPYKKEDLLEDIKKLDHVVRRYSIIAVRDTFNAHPRKFLLYYDKGWDCKFFLNYPSGEDGVNDIQNITRRLSAELDVDEECINVIFKGAQLQKKYSTEHNEYRTYKHSLYEASVNNFPDNEKTGTFEIDGRKYYWMTFDEMMEDERIKEHNSEVVDLVKNYI